MWYFILNKINPLTSADIPMWLTSESQFSSAEASLPRPHSFIILLGMRPLCLTLSSKVLESSFRRSG
ncbi:MAG: hypothetical protein ACTS5A_01000 [Candidatus Hodgkinia cicadicola]